MTHGDAQLGVAAERFALHARGEVIEGVGYFSREDGPDGMAAPHKSRERDRIDG